MNFGSKQPCDTGKEIQTGKEQYATNSTDMHDFQVFVTNQLISLSNKIDNGFTTLNMQIDYGLKRCDDRLTTLNKRFDDFIAQHPVSLLSSILTSLKFILVPILSVHIPA
jgi:hypothetical protein